MRGLLKKDEVESQAGTAQGIIDRGEPEERLRESEERWRSLVAASMDAVLLTIPDGRILSANPAAEKMFGFSEQELIQAGRSAIVDASDPRLAAAVEERARMGRFHGELTFVKKDGSKFQGEASSVIFTNSRGELCTSMVVRDVTARRRDESALRASEAALRVKNEELMAILDSTPAITFIAHDPECHYVTCNRAASMALNLPPGAAASKGAPPWGPKSFRLLKDGYELAPNEMPLEQSASTGKEIRNIELTLVFADGSSREVVGNTAPLIDEHGRIRGAVETFLDITERRQAEQRLRKSEESLRELAGRLEQIREEERSRIARAIHDELGHALTDMKLDLAWIDRRLEERGYSRRTAVRKRLAQISHQVDDQAQGVRRIATELRPAVLDALGLPAAIEWQAQEFQRQTKIRCDVQTNEGVSALPVDHSTVMFRALQELLKNVVKHAQATRVVIRLTKKPGCIVLEVADNGRGITVEEQSRPMKFGLLGVRERATALGGEVFTQGVPGHGTTVVIHLPADTL